MTEVGLREFVRRTSEIVTRVVESGESVELLRDGQVAAILTPLDIGGLDGLLAGGDRVGMITLRELSRSPGAALDLLERNRGAVLIARHGQPYVALIDSRGILAQVHRPDLDREGPSLLSDGLELPEGVLRLDERLVSPPWRGREDDSSVTGPEPLDVRDVFISHAREDKVAIARPLAEGLIRCGVSVWYDEYELTLGVSLSAAIDRGISTSRYGVVIISRAFMHKPWAQRELAGLVARETSTGQLMILPVWHEVSLAEVLAFSPPLADRFAIDTQHGVQAVITEVLKVVTYRRAVGESVGRPLVAADL